MTLKALCIDASPPPAGQTAEHALVAGDLYNIELVDPPRWPGDEYGVRITGNRSWLTISGEESFWRASRFRRPHKSIDITVDLQPVESGFDIYEH